jgi:hypothetical protein
MLRRKSFGVLAAALLLLCIGPIYAFAPAKMESVSVNVETGTMRVYGNVGRTKSGSAITLSGKVWIQDGATAAGPYTRITELAIPNTNSARVVMAGSWRGQSGQLVINVTKTPRSVYAVFKPTGSSNPTFEMLADAAAFDKSWEKSGPSIRDTFPDSEIPVGK